jgi:hypothetical protein
MKRVYSSQNTMMAGLIKGLLENNGIDCLMKNQILSSGIGELPLNECWPEVWISDDDDFDRAMELVEHALSSPENPPSSWRCKCGEEIEGQFELCWHCGNPRPE